MLHARQSALAEGISHISPRIQTLVDAARTESYPLDSSARAALEPIAGSDLSQLRLHNGPAAASLSRSLHARAFTQGRDVFLGTEADENTLAHEAVHVAEGRTGRGAIQRDDLHDEDKDKDPWAPGAANRPLNDLKTVRNSAGRLNYAELVRQNAIEALAEIRQARQAGDLQRAERLAYGAYEFRKDLRAYTRERISPAAVKLSETVEKDRSWTALTEKYAKADPFDTYEAIAAGSGRTDPNMTGFAEVGAYGGALMFGWDTGEGIEAIMDAPPGQRAQVAAEVVGGNLGSYGGAEAGMALGAAGAGFFLSNPGGWAILAALGLSYFGGKYGGKVGSAIFGAPFRIIEGLSHLPEALAMGFDLSMTLANVAGAPFRQAGGLIGGVGVRIRASLDVNNWDLRYFPPELRGDAIAVGGAVWLRVQGLDDDGMLMASTQTLAELGVPDDAVERLARGLANPQKSYTPQELMSMKPMEFMDVLRQGELTFTQSPEILQGWSVNKSKAQFYDRPLIRLREQINPEQWVFDRPTPDAAPVRALGRAIWKQLEPLNEKSFADRSRLTLRQLGIGDAALQAAADGIAKMMQQRSSFGLDWGMEPEMLAGMTPEDLVTFLNSNTGLDYTVSPDAQADLAVKGIQSGYEPW